MTMGNSLTGNSIGSLASADIKLDTDYFIVSARDKYLKDVYESKCSHASDMLRYLIYDVVDSLYLSSMSKHNVDEYSKRVHNHNDKYNKLNISYVYPKTFPDGYPLNPVDQSMGDADYKFDGYPIKTNALTSSISIGNMFVDGLLSTVYMPMSCCYDFLTIPWQMTEPLLGEIKFVALDTIRSIGVNDVLNDDFDGWLWLNNNVEYPLTAFRLSDDIVNADFINTLTGEGVNRKFTLKNANDYFFKINNNQPSLKSFESNTNNIEVPKHLHPVQFTVNGTASVSGQLSIVEKAGDGGFIHKGNGKSSHIPKERKSNGNVYQYGYMKNGSFINTYGSRRKEISTLVCRYRKDGSSDRWTYDDNITWQQIWEMDGNKISFSSIDISADCNLQFNPDANLLGNTGFDGETYPSHTLMPVMVYVGRKKDYV